jgi:hypothetical protein
VGCCLGGCLRLVAYALWRAIFAALVAIFFARIDDYIERSGRGESPAGKAWRAYRSRGQRVKRGTPPGASSAIDTEGRSRP